MAWRASKSARAEYGEKMREIERFCEMNGISRSHSGDSYYFSLNGKDYRVSNHTIAASDSGAYRFDEFQGIVKTRDFYHDPDEEVVEITAGKTRIIEIFNDLKAGYQLDKRGRRK